jgi:hypothetical protein
MIIPPWRRLEDQGTNSALSTSGVADNEPGPAIDEISPIFAYVVIGSGARGSSIGGRDAQPEL